jgi:hypothetical protein
VNPIPAETKSALKATASFDELLTASVTDVQRRYDDTDVMLYALGIGFGLGDRDSREMNFIYDGRGLRTMPSMAGVLVGHEFLKKCGLDTARVTTTEQKIDLYRPLPAQAELQLDSRVVSVLDHGSSDGLSVIVESEVRMTRDSTVLFTLNRTLMTGPGELRGPAGAGPAPHSLPKREPDLSCELYSHKALPYLFRLSGDRNPRYAEDLVARSHGFPRAPLSEQCVAGLACRAILKTICEYDSTLISGFNLSFKGALYPGEVLVTEMWQDRNIVSFRCTVPERAALVVDHGKCTLAV